MFVEKMERIFEIPHIIRRRGKFLLRGWRGKTRPEVLSAY